MNAALCVTHSSGFIFMILNCSTYESTKASIADIFRASEDRLISVLSSVNPFDDASEPPENVLYKCACNAFGEPDPNMRVLWFHGSRVENHNLFREHGILTKSQARRFIEPRLVELAKGLQRAGDNPFSTSLMGKQGAHDEGPFAFLIRDVAIQAPAPCHNYLESPELVEDLAGIMLGENYKALVGRFKEVTKPCVVSFLSKAKGYELPRALLYVKLVEDGEGHLEAASAANTFFSAEGEVITPEVIQDIELVQNA